MQNRNRWFWRGRPRDGEASGGAGRFVRVVQRKAPAALPDGVAFLAADVLDRESLRAACGEAG